MRRELSVEESQSNGFSKSISSDSSIPAGRSALCAWSASFAVDCPHRHPGGDALEGLAGCAGSNTIAFPLKFPSTANQANNKFERKK
jgi:hypothetical protein